MLATPLGERFFGSTRGRIVALLRTGALTASELAQQLGLTDTAIRMHLSGLERDGLIRRAGLRRGAGKPAQFYELTQEAEQLYPKGFENVVRALLGAAAGELPPRRRERLVRAAGRHLAASLGEASPGATVEDRLTHALTAFGALGGMPEVERGLHGLVVSSASCPLAGVAAEHPEACTLLEEMLSVLLKAPLREACSRGASPRCTFLVTPPTT